MIMAVSEHAIHRSLTEHGGSASKKNICRVLGDNAESRKMIDES